MTRKEAFEHYEYLIESGKIDSFRQKTRYDLSGKDLELFFYDDGHVMYNPFCGSLTTYNDPYYTGPRISPEFLKSLGHLGGKRVRSFSDLSQEELKLFNDCDSL